MSNSGTDTNLYPNSVRLKEGSLTSGNGNDVLVAQTGKAIVSCGESLDVFSDITFFGGPSMDYQDSTGLQQQSFAEYSAQSSDPGSVGAGRVYLADGSNWDLLGNGNAGLVVRNASDSGWVQIG